MINCFLCKKPVISSKINFGDKIYHVDCFKCSKCETSLKGTNEIKHENNILMCEACFNKIAPRCQKCKQLFEKGASYKKLKDNVYFHSDCFICSGPCKKPINSSYFQEGYENYLCKECNDLNADRCNKCNKVFDSGIKYRSLQDNIFFSLRMLYMLWIM